MSERQESYLPKGSLSREVPGKNPSMDNESASVIVAEINATLDILRYQEQALEQIKAVLHTFNGEYFDKTFSKQDERKDLVSQTKLDRMMSMRMLRRKVEAKTEELEKVLQFLKDNIG